jgi:ribosomal protein S1
LSATETLFPLKEFFSIQVTDHVDVAQTVRAAVERAADYQVQVDENYRRFVRLCPGARYRRMNRALFEKFIAQLED